MSPSSDNKAFPMTHLSGQELKPGNRKQQTRRRRGQQDDGKNNTVSQGEKSRGRNEQKAHLCVNPAKFWLTWACPLVRKSALPS